MPMLVEELRPACATIKELCSSIASALAAPERASGMSGEEPGWFADLIRCLDDIPCADWAAESIKIRMKAFQKERGIKGRDFYHALRLKITGREEGPPLALIISCLGKTAAIERVSGAASR
jgi:glutamyl/glutaminyl-tRNA synthetase